MGDIMFFVFRDDAISLDIGDIATSDLALGYIKLCDIDEAMIRFSLPQRFVDLCKARTSFFHFEVEKQEECLFAKIRLINPSHNNIDSDLLAIFIKRNLLLVVDISDTDGSIRDKVMHVKNSKMPALDSVAQLTLSFLEGAIIGDSEFFENTQCVINRLELDMLNGDVDNDINYKLLNLKQTLLFVRSYYIQLLDIVDACVDWSEDLFEPSELGGFRIFGERVKRLIDIVGILRDSVVQLRDAYNSSLELKLNKTMKIFTVFTVFLTPITLVTGWYGMNFVHMPELNARFGYAIPICLSLGIVLCLFAWFRHKKWI